MIKVARALILLSVLCLPGLSDVAADAAAVPGLPQFSPVDPPRPAPDITVTGRDGKAIRLSELRGRPVLINLWATWCVPCVAEMPSLERLAAERAGGPLAIMAISEDRKGEALVAAFVERLNLASLRIYLDNKGAATRAFGVDAIPTTILIDRQGREVGRLLGAVAWDGPAARKLIDRLVDPGDKTPQWTAQR